LVSLDLSFNRLSELPDALGSLAYLETLNINDNLLTEINHEIFSDKMTKLSSFMCANNLLTSLPESFFTGN